MEGDLELFRHPVRTDDLAPDLNGEERRERPEALALARHPAAKRHPLFSRLPAVERRGERHIRDDGLHLLGGALGARGGGGRLLLLGVVSGDLLQVEGGLHRDR